MPLSEREQPMLKKMEAQLQTEDPGFASSLQEPPVGRFNVRDLVLGLLLAVAGIGVVVFATTGGAGDSNGSAGGSGNGGSGGSGPRSSAPSPSGGSFMSSMEQKWEQRRQQP